MRRLLLTAVLVLVAVSIRAAQPEGEQINLTAETQEWVENTWRGVGKVRITYQDVSIQCDSMELDRSTMELVARGNVVIDQGPQRLSAHEVRYNLRSKTGVFLEASAFMPPSYSFSGEVLEKLDETHFRLENATFTTCEPGERTPWEFRSASALIEIEGYGTFRGTSVRVRGVPIFYLPYLVWPVKQDRTTGLLVPSFGYSKRRGGYLGNAFYLALGRSWDTTAHLDLFTEGHAGLGSEWRWAPEADARGDITLYTLRDADTGNWEWKVNGTHRDDNVKGFKLLSEVHEISDIDFFQEFERSFDNNARRDTYTYLYLTRSWGPTALNLRADRRVTFLSSNDVYLHQLPEVELRVRPTRVGRSSLYWSLISSANLLNVDRGGEFRGTYGRVDVFPSVSYTLPGPAWLSMTPRVGVRGTYWTKRYAEGGRSFENQGVDRTYAEAGLDLVGPSFSRVFEASIGPYQKFKHLVEPRIAYSYVSDPGDTSRVPLFDEVDSTFVTHRARFTLANRLFGRGEAGSTARELASLELYQDYSFDEPLNFSSDRSLTSQYGPLGASLRVTPVLGLSVDTRVSYDTLFRNLRSTSLSAFLTRGGSSLNLTWYQGFTPSTGQRSSSQVRTAFGYGGRGKPFKFNLHLAYDIENQEFLQQRAVVEYEGSCWGIAVEYRDLRAAAFPTRDYRITIDFKGVGKLIEIQGGLSSLGQ